MISRLHEDDYEKVRSLFKELEYNLITSAVIEGTSPGRIYVDDTANPQSAFLCSVEGYYLAGNSENDDFNESLNSLIMERIFSGYTTRKDETDVAIGFYPDTWKDRMKVIFKGRTPIVAHRRHYICRKVRTDWKSRVPTGFSLHLIDGKLLEELGPNTPRHIADWMEINWGSRQNFLGSGFGFCMLHGEEVVSWSIADCVSGSLAEIGIRTRPDYRKRGLASLTAAAAVDYWLSKGSMVGWHCPEENLGSRGVAEKVGFELERKYTQCYACFNEIHHAAEMAFSHFSGKKYKEALKNLRKVFSAPKRNLPTWMPERLPAYHHLAAEAWAALGHNQNAMKLLEMAFAKGWRNIDSTKKCELFKGLQNKLEWKELLKKYEQKKDR
ncbi:MAG: GNAT family N-acetyltransferase [Candidatus Bathyarchaeota archaeon]|nr:MAG: GNAT family N-acetyltransferase [Candidatus Bathyarchaeota archaeon]